jgi:hypothetical protein
MREKERGIDYRRVNEADGVQIIFQPVPDDGRARCEEAEE